MSTETDVDISVATDIFANIDLNEKVECSYTDCDVEATHMLQCPEDKSCETMCDEHTQETMLARATIPGYRITFDNTCGHSPLALECEILPLAK